MESGGSGYIRSTQIYNILCAAKIAKLLGTVCIFLNFWIFW